MVFFVLSALLSGCGNKIIEKVGDKPITQNDLVSMEEKLKPVFKDAKGIDIRKEALKNLEAQKAVELKAESEGIKVSSEEVDKAFKSLDKNAKMTKQDMKDILLSDKLFRKYTDNITLSEQEAKDWYNRHKDQFTQVKVYRILTDSKDKAEKAVSELKNGTDFDTVFNKYAVNLTDRQGMDFKTGDKIGDFKVVPEEISSPQKENSGYAVYKTSAGTIKPFSEVKAELMPYLSGQKKILYYNSLLSDWIKQYKGVKK
jgi:foldase protein PrsA